MKSSKTQFKAIVVLILLIAATPLFAAEDVSEGKKRGEKRRPESRQQQRGEQNGERRQSFNSGGAKGAGKRNMDRMYSQLIPVPVKGKLNLTKKQETQIAKIQEGQAAKIKELSGKLLQLRGELRTAVFEKDKEADIRKIARKMGSIMGNIAVKRSKGHAALSDILDEKQLAIIAKFRKKSSGEARKPQKGMEGQRKEIKSGKGSERPEHGERPERGQRSEGVQRNPKKMFENRDANDDDKLTPDEMGGKEKSKRFFERFDANKDGAVTMSEFNKMAKDRPEGNGKRPRGRRRDDDDKDGDDDEDKDDD